MTIQIDSREKARAIQKILADFDAAGVNHISSKLYVGDYMSLDNPRLIIDRKQSLSELCLNVCQQHKRFTAELIRAKEAGIHIVILCEHGGKIKSLEDVREWINPQSREHSLAKNGESLYKTLKTMMAHYDFDIVFCDKRHTGQQIRQILSEGVNGGCLRIQRL